MAVDHEQSSREAHRASAVPAAPTGAVTAHADSAADGASGTGAGILPIGATERTRADGLIPLAYAAHADDDQSELDRPLYASIVTGLLSLVLAAGCGVMSLAAGYYAVAGFRDVHQMIGLAVGLGFAMFMGFGAVALGLVAWEELVARHARVGRTRRSAPPHVRTATTGAEPPPVLVSKPRSGGSTIA